jgi:hypothetical protein
LPSGRGSRRPWANSRSHPQIFLGSQRFELFFRNQRNQTANRKPARPQVECSQGIGFGAWGFRRVRSRPVEHLFSRHVAEREGVVKSLGSSSGDRGAARAYPEIVKLFLGDRLAMSLRIASFEEPMDVGAEADASRVQASTAQPNSYSGR